MHQIHHTGILPIQFSWFPNVILLLEWGDVALIIGEIAIRETVHHQTVHNLRPMRHRLTGRAYYTRQKMFCFHLVNRDDAWKNIANRYTAK
jgi:hypothetical protein